MSLPLYPAGRPLASGDIRQGIGAADCWLITALQLAADRLPEIAEIAEGDSVRPREDRGEPGCRG